jgi:hypothetical protein
MALDVGFDERQQLGRSQAMGTLGSKSPGKNITVTTRMSKYQCVRAVIVKPNWRGDRLYLANMTMPKRLRTNQSGKGNELRGAQLGIQTSGLEVTFLLPRDRRGLPSQGIARARASTETLVFRESFWRRPASFGPIAEPVSQVPDG